MSVEVRASGRKLEAGIPRPLFEARGRRAYSVTEDGQRFLVTAPGEPRRRSP